MSSPAPASQSDAPMSDSQQSLAPPPAGNGNLFRSSSPLAFPSSSAGGQTPRPNGNGAVPASAAGSKRDRLLSSQFGGSGRGPSSGGEPLFFPGSNASSPASRVRRPTRGDVHSSNPSLASPLARRQVALPPSSLAHPPSSLSGIALSHPNQPPSSLQDDEGGDQMVKVVWGTNIVLQKSMDAFESFLTDFKLKYRKEYDRKHNPSTYVPLQSAAHGEQRTYEGYLRLMRLKGETNLNLDLTNLLAFPLTEKLHAQVLAYPQEIIPIMDQVLKDVMIELARIDLNGQEGMEEELRALEEGIFKVRPFGGVIKEMGMRGLNPADTDKLVTIKGLVIRATPIIPDMKVAFFRCTICSHTLTTPLDRGAIAEPTRCPREVCGAEGGMSLVHNRCEFADRQGVRLQEVVDDVPDGQTPHTISLQVYDEIVDLMKPGDRVSITGIFRSVPVRFNPRQRTLKALFKTFVDVIHVKRMNVVRMGYDPSTREGAEKKGRPPGIGVGGEEEDDEDLERASTGATSTANAEMEAKLLALSKRPDIYSLLVKSLAPSIWEMDDVKKGILLQLFGGTNKSISRGGGAGGPRYRGDINVLMVGDPGTSKSQILQYVNKIAPRGVYTSGKGSSAVGLTAYITRDPDSKQLVLESGALVLSDGGVCCIDEFDKMSDATRSVLHEVMEQQTVSIAKAGIITTLNARTSILAAANPVGSKYNPKWPITRNIDLPPTLISRFDLLYLVLDKIDEGLDRRLAKHLVGLYLEDKPEGLNHDTLPVETVTAYITYARAKINPIISHEAGEALVESYIQMRKVGEDPRSSERRITATTRQLESMIRLSEAHARMRFSETVDVEDVKEAGRLIREAIRESATDPITGQIDMDLVNTGIGGAQRRVQGDLKRAITALIETSGTKGIRWQDAVRNLEEQSDIRVDSIEFTDAIRALETEGVVKVNGERERRVIMKMNNA